MSTSALSEALRPIAARMSKVVREHEILRVAATVHGKDAAQSAEAARREVLAWAQNRSGGRLPPEAWAIDGFEHLSGGRNCAGVRIQMDQSDIWALRADDPDKKVPGRVWTNEVLIAFKGRARTRLSARLLVSTSEDGLDIEPHTPGFVQQVAEKCGLSRGLYDLNPEPWLIDSDDEGERLIEMLIDQERKLPLFVLTVAEGSNDPHRPLLDASALARAVLGIGHVVIVPAAFTWALTARIGRQRSVFGGAVRAYLPGFAEDVSPYGHRLVLAEHISNPEDVAQCTRWMRSLAASESIRRTRLGDDVVSFGTVRNATLELKQQQLEHEGASDSQKLEAAPGVRNSPCGADEFKFWWRGQPCTADWHIKNGGNTRDPKRCLRIYYFWDAVGQQVVIVDMPAHRPTAAT